MYFHWIFTKMFMKSMWYQSKERKGNDLASIQSQIY